MNNNVIHARLGHVSERFLQSVICEACSQAKAHKTPNRKEVRHMLPFTQPSINEDNIHILIIIDHASNFIKDFYAKTITSEFVISCLKKFMAIIKCVDANIKHYHSDGAPALIGQEIRNFLEDNFITWSYNAPYTPKDNGKCERSFRTIKEKALSQLIFCGLPSNFWQSSL